MVSVGGLFALGASVINLNDQQTFFSSLQTELNACGFPISERLVPVGFAVPPHQVIYRFRGPEGSILFQAGSGVFTVNAVPPYRSWHEFEPALQRGIEALFRARQGAEHSAPLHSVSLRYVNAFRARHLAGKTPSEFMHTVLGIYTHVPDVIDKYRVTDHPQAEAVQLTIPIDGGMTLSLVVTEGVTNGEAGLIVDFSVSTLPGRVIAESDAIALLMRAHEIIHDIFAATTTAIRDVLQPEDIA